MKIPTTQTRLGVLILLCSIKLNRETTKFHSIFKSKNAMELLEMRFGET